MDNGEQGRNKIIPHSVLMMGPFGGGGGGNEEESCVWTKESKAKAMYIVVVLLCSFFVLPFQVCFFIPKKTNLQSTYPHT
jgi:hypothetical protein